MHIRKAVFPVAGLGTRFLPATKAMPKEMLPVVDKPLIQYALEEAVAAGIEQFIFVTGRGKTLLEDHFDHAFELADTLARRDKHDILDDLLKNELAPGQLFYTRQKEPLGLGHAVWCARHLVGDEAFAVISADDLFLSKTPVMAQMTAAAASVGGNLIAAMEVPEAQVQRYGIIDPGERRGDLIEVRGLEEKPSPAEAKSNLAIIGRYILQPEIFDHLAKHERGAGGEIQLTDAMAKMIGEVPFHGFTFEGQRFDCGDKLGYLQANAAIALSREDLAADYRAYLEELLR